MVNENISVSPKFIGVVTAINVKEGQEGNKGQVLAQLDDAVLKQSLATLVSSLTFATIYTTNKKDYGIKDWFRSAIPHCKNNKESLEIISNHWKSR